MSKRINVKTVASFACIVLLLIAQQCTAASIPQGSGSVASRGGIGTGNSPPLTDVIGVLVLAIGSQPEPSARQASISRGDVVIQEGEGLRMVQGTANVVHDTDNQTAPLPYSSDEALATADQTDEQSSTTAIATNSTDSADRLLPASVSPSATAPCQPKRNRLFVSFKRLGLNAQHCNPDNKPDPMVEDHLSGNATLCPFHFVCRENPSVIPSHWWEARLSGPTRCHGCCQRTTVKQLRLKKRGLINKGDSNRNEAERFHYRAQYEEVQVGFVCLDRCG